jgi:hypothetical protein
MKFHPIPAPAPVHTPLVSQYRPNKQGGAQHQAISTSIADGRPVRRLSKTQYGVSPASSPATAHGIPGYVPPVPVISPTSTTTTGTARPTRKCALDEMFTDK